MDSLRLIKYTNIYKLILFLPVLCFVFSDKSFVRHMNNIKHEEVKNFGIMLW